MIQDYSAQHTSRFQIATTSPFKLIAEPTLFIPVSLPMALDFKRGRMAEIPWPDCMIKQPTDKTLVLEVDVPPMRSNEKRKSVISHWYGALKTIGLWVFLSVLVDVQSIKWISCKRMYKGYRRAPPAWTQWLPHKTIFVMCRAISSEKIWLCFAQPKNWFAGVYIIKGKMDPAPRDPIRHELF